MTTEAAALTRRNGLATASLIVGILTFIPGLLLSIVGSFIGLLAVALGIIALVQMSKDKTRGQGAAVAGIVLGAIGAFLAPFFTIALLMILGPAIGNTFSTINNSLNALVTPTP